MSEILYDLNKAKIDAMLSGFQELGITQNMKIGEQEITYFLNQRSQCGKFDPVLGSKFFQILSEEYISEITVQEFINNFLLFEEDLKNNLDMFERKLAKEREIYYSLEEKCLRYKSEKLNAEGFCENAKIYGEITDVDIQRKLEGIKEIIISVVYNEKIEEIRFEIGGLNSNATNLHKKFEFKPESRNDHFEFIMKGVNDKGQIFDIGNKIFLLNDVNSQEEYSFQIIIPEIDDEQTTAAYINGKIVFYWSDYLFYENQRKQAEKRLKKLSEATEKAKIYLLKVKEIYGNLLEKKPDVVVDFNNEKLIQRNSHITQLNINDEKKQTKIRSRNVQVEFNNKKEISKNIEFNNKKTVIREKLIQIQKEKELLKIDPIQILENHHPPIVVDNTKNVLYGNEIGTIDESQKVVTTQIIKRPIEGSVKVNPPKYINDGAVSFGPINITDETTYSSINVINNNNDITNSYINYTNDSLYNTEENQKYYGYNLTQETAQMNQTIIPHSIRPTLIRPAIIQNLQKEKIMNRSTSKTRYELRTRQPIITNKILPTKFLPIQTRKALYTNYTSPVKYYNNPLKIENVNYTNNIQVIKNCEISGITDPFLTNVNGMQYTEGNGLISTKIVNLNKGKIVDPITGVVIASAMD